MRFRRVYYLIHRLNILVTSANHFIARRDLTGESRLEFSLSLSVSLLLNANKSPPDISPRARELLIPQATANVLQTALRAHSCARESQFTLLSKLHSFVRSVLLFVSSISRPLSFASPFFSSFLRQISVSRAKI